MKKNQVGLYLLRLKLLPESSDVKPNNKSNPIIDSCNIVNVLVVINETLESRHNDLNLSASVADERSCDIADSSNNGEANKSCEANTAEHDRIVVTNLNIDENITSWEW